MCDFIPVGTNYALPERQQLPLSSHGRMWTGVHGTMPSVSRPANSSTTSSSRHNSSSSTIMAGSPSPTDTSAPSVIPATSTSNYRRQLSVKVTKPASKQGPQTQVPSSPARLSLHLKSSNIWFGGFHMRLERTVTLSEKGFMFTLNGEVAGELKMVFFCYLLFPFTWFCYLYSSQFILNLLYTMV